MLAHSSSIRLPSPPADRNSKTKSLSSLTTSHSSSQQGHHLPPHPFLQSPTHARSNSGSLPPLMLSHSHHSHHSYSLSQQQPQHTASKDVAFLTRTDSSSSIHSSVSSSSGWISPTSTSTAGPGSPELLSFASGYSLHHNNHNTTTTLAQPVAIYPQEHPQRRRFSPRHSASGSSYTNYSSALALTLAEQQHQQQQQQQYHHNYQNLHHFQQQQQQQRKSCQSSRSNSFHADNNDNNNLTSTTTNPNTSTVAGHSLNNNIHHNHHHHQQQQLQHNELNRAQYHRRSRHGYPNNSPPSPCSALDATSCHCGGVTPRSDSPSAGFSTDSSVTIKSTRSKTTRATATGEDFNISSPSLPPRLLSPISPISSSCSQPSMDSVAAATSMAHCSPVLTHRTTRRTVKTLSSSTTTAKLLPTVPKLNSSSNNGCQSRTTDNSSSNNSSEPSSPVDVSPCSPPTSVASTSSTLTSCSSLASSPVRTRRTSSLTSAGEFEYFESAPSASATAFFNNPTTVLFSPSPSPPLLAHSSASQAREPQYPKQQQGHSSRRLERDAARRSLGMVVQGQGILQDGHGQQSNHHRYTSSTASMSMVRQQQQQHRRPLSTSSNNSSARASLGIHAQTVSQPQHQQQQNQKSGPLMTTTALTASNPLSSPQAIAQSSSRYIRFIWLPLLPLLILALGGQTSSKFENPVKYNV